MPRLTLVAITGTPGTGKTSVGRELRALGFPVLLLNRTAKRFTVGRDRARRTDIIDVRRLDRSLGRWIRHYDLWEANRKDFLFPENWLEPEFRDGESNLFLFLEGHFAHELSFVDRIVVLRLDPREVERRLRRKHSRRKARENAEAEAIGVIAGECRHDRRATEVDVTGLTRAQAARRALRAARAPKPPRVGRVDWADAILAW
jgi:adenylate kinase